MKLANKKVLRIVRKLHSELAAIYGGRLKEVYLYGSYARGQANKDSDIDVAVVLSGEVNRAKERWRVSDLASDISLEENCLLVLFFMSETEEKDKPYAIHRNIIREGVPV